VGCSGRGGARPAAAPPGHRGGSSSPAGGARRAGAGRARPLQRDTPTGPAAGAHPCGTDGSAGDRWPAPVPTSPLPPLPDAPVGFGPGVRMVRRPARDIDPPVPPPVPSARAGPAARRATGDGRSRSGRRRRPCRRAAPMSAGRSSPVGWRRSPDPRRPAGRTRRRRAGRCSGPLRRLPSRNSVGPRQSRPPRGSPVAAPARRAAPAAGPCCQQHPRARGSGFHSGRPAAPR
jgi:hypothetical protein